MAVQDQKKVGRKKKIQKCITMWNSFSWFTRGGAHIRTKKREELLRRTSAVTWTSKIRRRRNPTGSNQAKGGINIREREMPVFLLLYQDLCRRRTSCRGGGALLSFFIIVFLGGTLFFFFFVCYLFASENLWLIFTSPLRERERMFFRKRGEEGDWRMPGLSVYLAAAFITCRPDL